MIKRYANEKAEAIWSDKHKLQMWLVVELAVILARELLGIFPKGIHQRFVEIFKEHPIDDDSVTYWKAKDKEIHHDLNAFLLERLRWMPVELHQYWHHGMTSYDTEEPAFALLLKESLMLLEQPMTQMKSNLFILAEKYRYTPMLGRTHGQEAKVQTFGKRCLTWLGNIKEAGDSINFAVSRISQSKLSGAIGNYQGLTPKEEVRALEILGLKPYIGATQIMPRLVYMPLANALESLVDAITQIAEDIRLGARSGLPIFQEPFAKKQMGSSAMPHKKNTITCENQIGMQTMARNFVQMLRQRTTTWEERAIEQSCVERIAWPDLFHVTLQSFKNLNKVLEGLQVFQDNMLQEIILTRGCFASEDAKEWLKEKLAPYGLTYEDAYRIVQAAAAQGHNISPKRNKIRVTHFKAYDQAEKLLVSAEDELIISADKIISIQEIIALPDLAPLPELDVDQEKAEKWNQVLGQIFDSRSNRQSWDELFTLSYQLREESAIFENFGLKAA